MFPKRTRRTTYIVNLNHSFITLSDHLLIIISTRKESKNVSERNTVVMKLVFATGCHCQQFYTLLRANPHKNQTKSNFFGKA